VVLEVVFNGCSFDELAAKREAVERIERAARTAGGVCGLVSVTATLGRAAAPPPVGRENVARGRVG